MIGASVAAEPVDDGEAEVIRRAKARDPEVWARWYDQYHQLLYRYAIARLRNPEDAADVVSQVFLEALKGVDGFRYTGRPVLAWFYGIARNLVAGRIRALQKLAAAPALTAECPDIGDAVVDKMALADAMAQLTDEQREAITLTLVLGMTVREVAALLGKKQSTVYSAQARGIAKLRMLMQA